MYPLFISPQLYTPTSAAVHLVLEVAQYFWLIWTVLEMSKLFWTAAAAIPILTAIPIVGMLECGVNTDSTQVKYTILLVSLPTYLLFN